MTPLHNYNLMTTPTGSHPPHDACLAMGTPEASLRCHYIYTSLASDAAQGIHGFRLSPLVFASGTP